MAQSQFPETGHLRLINGLSAAAFETQTTPHDPLPILANLPMRLQTTLDLTSLFNIFNEQCQLLLGPCVLSYQHEIQGIHLFLAKHLTHSCQYQLELNQEILGQLTISRRNRFSDDDTHLIEEMLCKFVYSLRNCLLYREALQAAQTDRLTRLPNRIAFEASLEREIALARRLETPLCLLVIDIDHFKAVNDQYGHQVGDQALKLTAETLMSSLRRTDIIFRYGGEEFVVLLSQCSLTSANHVAERLRQDIEQLNSYETQYGTLTISIGLSQFVPSDDPEQFFRRADKALYQAKANGRNQVQINAF